jgi:hypothetical protein
MEEKAAYSEPFNTTRELVNFLNTNRIPIDDIVGILDRKDQLLLIYYK